MTDNGVFSCSYGCCMYTEQKRDIDTNRLIQARDATDLCAVLYAEVRRIRDKYKDMCANNYTSNYIKFDLEQLCKSVVTYLETHGTKLNLFEITGSELKPVSVNIVLYNSVSAAVDAAMRLLDFVGAGIVDPVRIDRFVYAHFKGIGNE